MANITPGSFVAPTQVEHRLYQPNFEMMLKSIQANQKFYDASMAKVNEVVDVLPGDVTERDVIAKGFSDRSEQVTDAYMQNVGRGSTSMRQLIRDIEKQNRPGGKYFEWKKKYQMWSEHQKTQKKRLDEGKIRQSQYWDSVMKPIQGYKTFSEDGNINPLNLMGNADATDFHKMALELVKEKEAELTKVWGTPKRIGGNIVWAHDTVNEIRYDDLMQEVSAALMAKGTETRELDNEFDFQFQGDAMKQGLAATYRNRYNARSAELLEQLAQIDAGEVPDKYAQDLAGLTPGSEAHKKALADLRNNISRQQQQAQSVVTDFDTRESDDKADLAKSMWTSNYIRNIADPYVGIKAKRDVIRDYKVFTDHEYTWQQKRAYYKWQKEQDVQHAMEATREMGRTVRNTMIDTTAAMYGLSGKNARTDVDPYHSVLVRDKTILGAWQKHRAKFAADTQSRDAAEKAVMAFLKDNPNLIINGMTGENYRKLIQSEAGYQQMGDRKKLFMQRVAPVLDLFVNKQQENFIYREYQNPDTQRSETQLVVGKFDGTGGWERGNMSQRPLKVHDPETGKWVDIPTTDALVENYTQTIKTASGKKKSGFISGRVLGTVGPINAAGLPTGDFISLTRSDGTEIIVLAQDKTREQSRELQIISDLAEAQYSLRAVEKDWTIIEKDKNGDPVERRYTMLARPIVSVDDSGLSTETTQSMTYVNVEIYDEDGNFVSSRSLDDMAREIENTSPYARTEKLNEAFTYQRQGDGRMGEQKYGINTTPQYEYYDRAFIESRRRANPRLFKPEERPKDNLGDIWMTPDQRYMANRMNQSRPSSTPRPIKPIKHVDAGKDMTIMPISSLDGDSFTGKDILDVSSGDIVFTIIKPDQFDNKWTALYNDSAGRLQRIEANELSDIQIKIRGLSNNKSNSIPRTSNALDTLGTSSTSNTSSSSSSSGRTKGKNDYKTISKDDIVDNKIKTTINGDDLIIHAPVGGASSEHPYWTYVWINDTPHYVQGVTLAELKLQIEKIK